jgi:hypothetical protein
MPRFVIDGCSGTRSARYGGTKCRNRTFFRMGPRQEDNALLLLVTVSLICATFAGIAETGRTDAAVVVRPTVVASDQPARVVEPVRVVLPFTPNTTPSQR